MSTLHPEDRERASQSYWGGGPLGAGFYDGGAVSPGADRDYAGISIEPWHYGTRKEKSLGLSAHPPTSRI